MDTSLLFEIIALASLTCGGGVGNSIFSGLMNKTIVGGVHFKKPWFQILLMFISFTLAFIPHWIRLLFLSWRKSQNKSDGMKKPEVKKPQVFKVGLFALFNLLSRVVANLGLLWLPVSIWQGLRGGALIFFIVLAATYRKRKLHRHEKIGIAVVSIVLAHMGIQAMLHGQKTPVFTWKILLGIVCVVGSQAFETVKTILMEVHGPNLNMHSFSIIAWHGVWGLVACSLILPVCNVLPGVEGDGIREHTLLSFHEMFGSSQLMTYSAGIVASLLCCGVFAAYLIKASSGRLTWTVLEQFRGVVVWVVSLMRAAISSSGGLWALWGEWSSLEWGCFLLIAFGTVVYSAAFVARCSVAVVVAEKSGDKKKKKTKSKRGRKEKEKEKEKEIIRRRREEEGEEERGIKSPELQIPVKGEVWEQDGKEEGKLKAV